MRNISESNYVGFDIYSDKLILRNLIIYSSTFMAYLIALPFWNHEIEFQESKKYMKTIIIMEVIL